MCGQNPWNADIFMIVLFPAEGLVDVLSIWFLNSFRFSNILLITVFAVYLVDHISYILNGCFIFYFISYKEIELEELLLRVMSYGF